MISILFDFILSCHVMSTIKSLQLLGHKMSYALSFSVSCHFSCKSILLVTEEAVFNQQSKLFASLIICFLFCLNISTLIYNFQSPITSPKSNWVLPLWIIKICMELKHCITFHHAPHHSATHSPTHIIKQSSKQQSWPYRAHVIQNHIFRCHITNL